MPDAENVGHGARLLAIETALRFLIDQTSMTDPAVRDRIDAAQKTVVLIYEMNDMRSLGRTQKFIEHRQIHAQRIRPCVHGNAARPRFPPIADFKTPKQNEHFCFSSNVTR